MNVEHERNLVLRERAESWREEKLIDADTERAVVAQLDVPWRAHGVIVQCVFFFLTCVGIVASYGLCHVLHFPGEGLIIGLASIATAEYLIRVKHWFGTGVEAALWIGGLMAMITELPSSGKPEAMLVFAAAAAISGARMRNPIFGAAAAIFVVIYAEERLDLGVVTSLVVAAMAVFALLRAWRRPSTEWLWVTLALALPVAGRFTADDKWRTVTLALYGLFGGLTFVLATVKRHHALFFAGAIGLTIAGVDIGRMITIPLEAKLAAAGASLLALSYLLARALRDRSTGIIVTPAKLTPADEAVEIAAAIGAAHATRSPEPGPAPETRPQGGGGFGGAGATGDF